MIVLSEELIFISKAELLHSLERMKECKQEFQEPISRESLHSNSCFLDSRGTQPTHIFPSLFIFLREKFTLFSKIHEVSPSLFIFYHGHMRDTLFRPFLNLFPKLPHKVSLNNCRDAAIRDSPSASDSK